ncbi:MAG TPA: ATP-dependent zinc metalloprotease FtsH [Stellaceae bacterium]|nr:ATP-dependent zinc metalloprotease FtsH [Stellaceae bacterium]
MEKKQQIHFWYVIAAVLLMLFIQSLYLQSTKLTPIPYSRFEALLDANKVNEVAITQNQIQGTLKEAEPDGLKDFVTTRVQPPELAENLTKHGVTYSGVVESHWIADLLSWILPAVFFVGIWMFAIRRMGQGGLGGLMTIGKSRAKIYVEKETKVTFADVAGVDEAKDELVEIVNFLKEPKTYGRLGGRAPKGVLLVGPPGTGKTLLARAVAGEAGVPFFSISGAEFVEMFVGVGAARVRDLFEQARQHAPAIIFIDELDALGRARGAYVGGGHDEKEQTLNQLLAELDGFDPTSGLVLLGATNRPEILDPALLRAGRFDRQILVDRPDKRGREQILAVHLRKAKLAVDVNPEQIAALTPGFTGADLANLVNEATLLATRRNADSVTMSDFTNAIERMVAGLEKRNRLLNPLERRVVAYHELGHAMVALALPGTDTVHKVSIIPHGVGALGYTIQRPIEDRYLMTRAELEHKMAGLLGGRAAEQLVFAEISTGAADDLAKATDIARAMVLRYGMSEALGNVAYDRDRTPFLQPNYPVPQERNYSEETANAVDGAVRRFVDHAFEQASAILRRNRSLLDRTASALLETETLSEPEIERVKQEIVAVPALPSFSDKPEVAATASAS